MVIEGLQTPSIQLSMAWFVTFTACHAQPNIHKQHTALPGHILGVILQDGYQVCVMCFAIFGNGKGIPVSMVSQISTCVMFQ